ncbi:serine hydrolase domain-containing protein [Sinomicrobium soli]|uniref:serine hydrolase domain-containing protein n=1 Tax=Sinomicrobium sp. N-1-3-6 TaxID=2219864 RepID=UPI000DCE2F72|nr:serine hydrolase domain-containing protein [Sinomicrobium sp. N-1-3-6]RAV29654.1 hypothetical protein DN748_05905 [Sinomicrobium sp. N-1-3-6]
MKSFRQGLLRAATACSMIVLCIFQTVAYAQSIEERLREEMEKYEAVGLAVVVVKDNEVIYKNSFGWKDKDKKIPLEEDDLFRIASISKSFSAIAVMQLLEQGKLSLDDDVSDLIGFPVRNPKFPDRPITLEMLLTHTSSLTDKQRYGSLDIINPEVNEDWAKSYADYAPGEKYQYCNLGYNTIGAIIERISGRRFDLYIKENILDPLGLYGGYLPGTLDASLFAQLYRYDRETGEYKKSPAYRKLDDRLKDYKMGYSAATLSPTGGMKISAPDLAKYMMMHMNYGRLGDVQVMTRESAKKMQQMRARMDSKRSYGYALRNDGGVMVPGTELIGHTGSAYGLNSGMMFDPEKKYGLVMISSGFIPADPDFRSRIMSILYDRFIESTPSEAPETGEVPVERFSLVLGGHGIRASRGNFVDMKKGKVLTLKEASAHQPEVDLLYTYGKNTGATLMVPASEGIQFFGTRYKEKVYEAWTHKNRGELVALEDSRENRKVFEEIRNNRQLRQAYDKALKEVGKRKGYKRWVHGPNARIQGLKIGDMVFLLINSREKGILSLIGSEEQEILAIGRISSIEEGFNGEIAIDFKVAAEQ